MPISKVSFGHNIKPKTIENFSKKTTSGFKTASVKDIGDFFGAWDKTTIKSDLMSGAKSLAQNGNKLDIKV